MKKPGFLNNNTSSDSLTDSQSRAETETVLTREPSKQTHGIEDTGSQSKRHLEGIESGPNFIESHKEYFNSPIAPKVKQIDKTNAKTKPEKLKYFIFHRVLLKVREAKFIKLPKEIEQLNENGKRKIMKTRFLWLLNWLLIFKSMINLMIAFFTVF